MWTPRFSAVVIFSLMGGLFMWWGVSPALAEKRVALVIGNSSYEHVSSLPNPDNDATDLAARPEKLGFIVRRERNLGRHAMRDVLAEFSDTANGADMAVVYYAGHGIGVDKQNFLIPVDARLSLDRKIKFATLPLDAVLASLEGVRGVRMILLDACRNNRFAGKRKLTSASRSVSRGLRWSIYLTQQQIVATHVGKCVSYWGKTRGTQCILANGTTNCDDKKWGKDTGKWWLEGGSLLRTLVERPKRTV